MHIAVVTLFPEMFSAVGKFGITGRAIKNGLVSLSCWNPRDYTDDRHRTVDDKPFGGGPGMLMKTAPLQAAIGAARESLNSDQAELGAIGAAAAKEELQERRQGRESSQPIRVVYLSPQGRRLDQQGVEELAASSDLILVCGRYQGIDERILETEIDEEWSIGDFVISGGELAAMVVIDAVTRLQPSALGDEDSAELDSFSEGLLHCPQYTRPQEFGGLSIPPVLLSGDHEQIRRWRLKYSLGATWQKRPDLLSDAELNSEQQELLKEYIAEYKASRNETSGRGDRSGAEQ